MSVEQDHRLVKLRLAPMLGFQCLGNARVVIAGVDLAQKISRQKIAEFLVLLLPGAPFFVLRSLCILRTSRKIDLV